MNLFSKIDEVFPKIRHGWGDITKAYSLASMVLALRPELSVEVGVWGGRTLIPMALAHKEIGTGMVVGIDPWHPAASVEGQINEADRKHWATADHEAVYQEFMALLVELKLTNCVTILRMKSSEAPPMQNISLLSLDGNHGPEAIKDVEKFAPMCRSGALWVGDDEWWTGGNVHEGMVRLEKMGWKRLYSLGNGVVFQRL